MVGALIRGCRCAMSWCDFDLTFDLVVVTLTFKILCVLHLRNRCRKLILDRNIGWGCRCAMSWCDLDLTFDLAVVTLSFKILSRRFLGFYKV